jgi:hypothetical protein
VWSELLVVLKKRCWRSQPGGVEEAASAKHRRRQLRPAHTSCSLCGANRCTHHFTVSRCIRGSVWRLATCVIGDNTAKASLHRRAALHRSPGKSSLSAVVQPCRRRRPYSLVELVRSLPDPTYTPDRAITMSFKAKDLHFGKPAVCTSRPPTHT